MKIRLVKWLCFSVVLGMFPVMNSLVIELGRDSIPSAPFSFHSFLYRGEYLLVGAVLCATAIGKLLVGTTEEGMVYKMVIGTCCLLVFGLVVTTYGVLAEDGYSPQSDNDVYFYGLQILFVASLVTSTAAIIATTER